MRYLIFLLFGINSSFIASAQIANLQSSDVVRNPIRVSIENWSVRNIFPKYDEPLATGYGTHSDALRKAYNGITFFEFDGEYYPINSWADYYLWFTRKHASLFNKPVLEYEYYYLLGSDAGMIGFIFSDGNYTGDHLPPLVAIQYRSKRDRRQTLAYYSRSRFDAYGMLKVAQNSPRQENSRFQGDDIRRANNLPINNDGSARNSGGGTAFKGYGGSRGSTEGSTAKSDQ